MLKFTRSIHFKQDPKIWKYFIYYVTSNVHWFTSLTTTIFLLLFIYDLQKKRTPLVISVSRLCFNVSNTIMQSPILVCQALPITWHPLTSSRACLILSSKFFCIPSFSLSIYVHSHQVCSVSAKCNVHHANETQECRSLSMHISENKILVLLSFQFFQRVGLVFSCRINEKDCNFLISLMDKVKKTVPGICFW